MNLEVNSMVLDLEKIKEMDPEELLDFVYNSMMELKPIEFRKNRNDELTKDIIRPSFDDIKYQIEYKNLDDRFKITVPVYDESERAHYKKSILLKDKYDILPITGYFVRSDVELIVKPLGLVEVVYSGHKISRNDNDFRYLRYHLEYQKVEYFCYDFETNKYVLVPEEIEKMKFQLARNGEVNLESAHNLVKTYMEREEVLNNILVKLKGLYELYQDKLKEFLFDNYQKNSKTTIVSVKDYYWNYAEFLIKEMPRGLKLKYVFSQISKREFDELLIEGERLIDVLMRGQEMLMKIYDLTGQKLDYDLLAGPVDGTEEFEIKNRMLDTILNKELLDFKLPRPMNFSFADPMKGYIKFDSENQEVFPNVAQLENRVLLNGKDDPEDLQGETEYIKQIIKAKMK